MRHVFLFVSAAQLRVGTDARQPYLLNRQTCLDDSGVAGSVDRILYSMQAHDTPKLRDTPDGDALLGGLDCWRG